ICGQVFFVVLVRRFAPALLEHGEHPLERACERDASPLALVLEGDVPHPGAVEDCLARFGGELRERRVEIEAEDAPDGSEQCEMELRGLAPPGRDRALA